MLRLTSLLALALVVSGIALLAPSPRAAAQDADAAPHTATFEDQWFYYGDRPERFREIKPRLQRLVGKEAPEFTVQRWVGDEYTMKDMRGEIVVLDFWGTWCPPCLRAIPHLNQLSETYDDQGVTVLGICDDTRKAERLSSTIKQYDMRYPTALDKNKGSFSAYNGQWYPFIVLVDRKGIIRAAGLTPKGLDKALEELLKEQPAPKPSEAS
ncbi:MAG: TlpA disulfide reductase family protein [Planctomycetota bacterium]